MNQVIKTAIAIVGTQKELAKACGVSQAAVQKWLYGKAKVSPQNVFSVVKATGGKVQGYQIRPDLPGLFPKPNQSA
ncbi:helix-turn-helix domain-containing protein [Salmonella enterica subsp. enterica]|nr:helix-turn-helix domain-containing protein [Salmonella enterica subsp. enterica serovar Newport]EBQ4336330.1 helix-turn-helix domain-containing protein [Salmonella enterica]EBX9481512.1 helix-turn-helix domain-containing protein [Salmonella enterica subsp. enterica serovar Abony]EBZ1023757.1 helix-turn-helix domain-containing protein [Salmonella enterica subsp. enterica serovar Muenchen]ECA3524908.1 helix-turn-helix domain-containing protein [Salmonella enterica subsp. enterica serovar Telha